MKTAISLPDSVYQAAERISKRKHISRSEFYTNAIRWYIEKEENRGITEQLNAVYGSIADDHSVAETTGINDLPESDWK
jgi:metal-responsive CopG/Arc/MetJ family transcriptional regulator